MKRSLAAVGVILALAASPLAGATDAKFSVQASDSIKSVLERQVKHGATLKLRTGEELSGTVTLVGDKVVHLSALVGKEFYDAVVALDAISAVVVRARDR